MSVGTRITGSTASARAGLRRLTRWVNAQTSIVLVFVAIELFAVLFVPRYAVLQNFKIMLLAIPTLGIMTTGVTLLMIAGEFDLSIGSIFVFCSALLAVLSTNLGISAWLALAVSLAVGAGIGVLNGYITLRARIPSFITTLATMMLFKAGAIALVSGAAVGVSADPVFKAVFAGEIGPMPVSFLWFVILALILYVVLEETQLGSWIFAAGGNKSAARAMGINTNLVKIFCFALVGVLSALAGAMEAAKAGFVYANAGEGMNLNSIAASVVGGTSLYGGSGSILGAFFGAIIIWTVQDILMLLRVNAMYFSAYVGGVIVLTVIFNTIVARRRE
jgi:simple sugar transport system permease protein